MVDDKFQLQVSRAGEWTIYDPLRRGFFMFALSAECTPYQPLFVRPGCSSVRRVAFAVACRWLCVRVLLVFVCVRRSLPVLCVRRVAFGFSAGSLVLLVRPSGGVGLPVAAPPCLQAPQGYKSRRFV